VRKAIRALNDSEWVVARRQDGQQREGAAVAEITHSHGSIWTATRTDHACWCAASRCTPAHSKPCSTSLVPGSPRFD
jgi:hypothetical protein